MQQNNPLTVPPHSLSAASAVTVELGARSYPIYIAEGALALLPEVVKHLGVRGTVAVCTDSNVGPLYGRRTAELLDRASIRHVTCTMPAGEEFKRLDRVEEFIGQFLRAGLDRGSLVVALGGGVLGDTAAFAAACFMRGIPFVQVPTTIVAQVDSSVGGKTGVNHPLGKNIIGVFHQPSAVLIDMALLKTLPDREYRAGLAEVIKHGVIADEALFEHMEREVQEILGRNLARLELPIRRSCEIKAAIVSADEREQGVRANLNYGHTFGHGIEAATGYTRFLHGEAISLGMCAAAGLARQLGMVEDDCVRRQRNCLQAYGLPIHWPEIDVNATLEAMKHDKKVRSGTMKFILPDRIGRVVHRTDITLAQARAAVESLRSGK